MPPCCLVTGKSWPQEDRLSMSGLNDGSGLLISLLAPPPHLPLYNLSSTLQPVATLILDFPLKSPSMLLITFRIEFRVSARMRNCRDPAMPLSSLICLILHLIMQSYIHWFPEISYRHSPMAWSILISLVGIPSSSLSTGIVHSFWCHSVVPSLWSLSWAPQLNPLLLPQRYLCTNFNPVSWTEEPGGHRT